MRRGGTSPSHAVRAFGVGTGRCRARHISDYHHESLRPRPRRHVDLPVAGERWNVTTHPANTTTNDGNRPAVSGALKKASFAISLILFIQFAQPFSVALWVCASRESHFTLPSSRRQAPRLFGISSAQGPYCATHPAVDRSAIPAAELSFNRRAFVTGSQIPFREAFNRPATALVPDAGDFDNSPAYS